jgi:exopolysaccharide biosynthesis polyprenyl glycosylphosphotransferase
MALTRQVSEVVGAPSAEPVAVGNATGLGWRPPQRRLVSRFLVAADIVGVSAAFAVAEFAAGGNSRDLAFLVLSLAGALAIFGASGLYESDSLRTQHSTADEVGTLVVLLTVVTFMAQAATWVLPAWTPNRSVLLVFWGTACAVVPCARAVGRAFARRREPRQNALIVGAGEIGQLYAHKFLQHPEYGVNFAGFLDDQPRERRSDLQDITILGATDDLRDVVERKQIDRIIVAFSNDRHDRTLDLIRSLEGVPVRVDIVPRLFEAFGHQVALDSVEALPLISLRRTRHGRLGLTIKRTGDIVGAAAGLALTAPLFAYAASRIHRESPGPVFFRQVRLGKDMNEITVLKFRTMSVDADPETHRAYIEMSMRDVVQPETNGLFKLEQRSAVTPFGRWLRKTSLDELPQLINVLRGEMSLVGPRPCLEYEMRMFAPHHFARFLVKPGMTGLWQVTARARSTFREALEMDAAYALNWSPGLDLALLLRTPLQLFRRNVSA